MEEKAKRKTLKEWVWQKSNNIRAWWGYNKEWAIVVIPIAIGGASWTIKKIVSGTITSINLGKEERLKNLYFYDTSLRNYWKLRRPLTTSEMLSLETRKKAGETIGEILMSMRVI